MVTSAFIELIDRVQACRRCPSMEGRRRVLSTANGAPGARVLFIAEAPGRRGGEVTGVPLTRDQSGQRFSRLLADCGLAREQVFITNAVLCNPRKENGCNRTPTSVEVRSCSGWLAAQISTVDAPVIATLGATALGALALIEPHGYRLREHAGQRLTWAGRVLVPLYHPSPRAVLSRTDAEQAADFHALATVVRTVAGFPP